MRLYLSIVIFLYLTSLVYANKQVIEKIDGGEYLLLISKRFSTKKTANLCVFLHGQSDERETKTDGNYITSYTERLQKTLARYPNTIFIFPNSLPVWEGSDARFDDEETVSFIKRTNFIIDCINDVKKKIKIEKIYIAGHSSGGGAAVTFAFMNIDKVKQIDGFANIKSIWPKISGVLCISSPKYDEVEYVLKQINTKEHQYTPIHFLCFIKDDKTPIDQVNLVYDAFCKKDLFATIDRRNSSQHFPDINSLYDSFNKLFVISDWEELNKNSTEQKQKIKKMLYLYKRDKYIASKLTKLLKDISKVRQEAKSPETAISVPKSLEINEDLKKVGHLIIRGKYREARNKLRDMLAKDRSDSKVKLELYHLHNLQKGLFLEKKKEFLKAYFLYIKVSQSEANYCKQRSAIKIERYRKKRPKYVEMYEQGEEIKEKIRKVKKIESISKKTAISMYKKLLRDYPNTYLKREIRRSIESLSK